MVKDAVGQVRRREEDHAARLLQGELIATAATQGGGVRRLPNCLIELGAPGDSRRRRKAGTRQADPCRQQHRGRLQPRHPGAQRRVARRAQRRHRGAARRQRRRQDHHAESDLQPAARRARRGHQGLDPVRGRGGALAHAERSGPPRLHPGDGGPPLLRSSHRRGEPADRRVHPPRRQGRGRPRSRAGLRLFPAPEGAPRARSPATRPAASSRCARSAAR